MGDSKANAFGKHFIANFAPEIMKSYLLQMELYMARKIWLSERCVYLIIDFLEEWYRIHFCVANLQYQAEGHLGIAETTCS